ncbi:hypothetical protein MMC25_000029 [Agyrium rufum]|nr:hypothetical protein [Agyrium rufum]
MLEEKSATTHNKLLGRRIPHPQSTKFDDMFASPTAKRVKRMDSTDSSLSRVAGDPDENDFDDDASVTDITTPKRRRAEIPDSEEESDAEDDGFAPPFSSQTELESALPPIRTDKEAIAEYEATRAAEAADSTSLKGEEGGPRKWIPGRSSIYVDAFNLALDTVLEDESHLFNEPEMAVFEQWKGLSYEAQYLYVRLFLRKTDKWHRVSRLGYYGDIADLPGAIEDLHENRSLPKSSSVPMVYPGEASIADDMVLGETFTFADDSRDHINTVDEAARLLSLDEAKIIAKDAKLKGKNKRELIDALVVSSQKQGGLGWMGLRRSDTEESARSDTSTPGPEDGMERRRSYDSSKSRESRSLQKILDITGSCIRLSSAVRRLFERVHLVFYRSTEWTEKSLTTIILARISRRNFPEFIVSRSTNIFPSRDLLLEFEASIRTQFTLDNILEFSGTPTKDGLRKVQDIFEAVYPRWQILLEEEQRKEDSIYASGEGAYLRRFSPAWVYTRIIHKGLYPLGRFKERKREHDLLSELLCQRLFHSARRGAWYQRKALLEEHYMWAIHPDDTKSEESQKKHWKRIALKTCEEALQDQDCHVIYHYDLQKRIMKIEKSLKIAKREQHDFGHALLTKAVDRYVEGTRIEKERAPSATGRRSSDSGFGKKGRKTIWVDEREGGGECSVEAMCLSWYRDQGWKGYHSEGSIIRTLFGYLFYDVLFTYVPNVFQTPYQTCPLDLHTDAFFPSRMSEINHRLVAIANGDAERIFREVHEHERENRTCVVGVDWEYHFDDLIEIIACFRGEALSTVCKVMAQEYQQRGGGIPDLFLWHSEKREVMFSEVKSENDHLSDTQRLWIHVLTGAGITVELCHAVAKEHVPEDVRVITEGKQSRLKYPEVLTLHPSPADNPTDIVAENQHWGHATSPDLYHWTNQPITLFLSTPEEGIFSGSAIVDPNNTSGFFPNQTNGVVAIYALNMPQEETQNITYSYDNGFTFTLYAQNPVLAIISTQFRDPKVIWYAPTSRWVMVVAYAQKFTVRIFTSSNLREWTHASNFSHAGLLGLQYECPNLVAIPFLRNASLMTTTTENVVATDFWEKNVLSTTAQNQTYIMFISINPGAPLGGSISQYFPGTFNGTYFTAFDGAARISDFGNDNYAGQFFYNGNALPGAAPISIAWASNWDYTNEVPIGQLEGWRSAMTLPRMNALANVTGFGYDLVQLPYGLDAVCSSADPLAENSNIGNGSLILEYENLVPSGAISFDIIISNIPTTNVTGTVNFTLTASSTGEILRGGYYLGSFTSFWLDRGKFESFPDCNPFFTDKFSTPTAYDQDTGTFTIKVVVDRSVLEVFVDGGKKSATLSYFLQGQLDILSVKAAGLNEGIRVGVNIWRLESAWAAVEEANGTAIGNATMGSFRSRSNIWAQ